MRTRTSHRAASVITPRTPPAGRSSLGPARIRGRARSSRTTNRSSEPRDFLSTRHRGAQVVERRSGRSRSGRPTRARRGRCRSATASSRTPGRAGPARRRTRSRSRRPRRGARGTPLATLDRVRHGVAVVEHLAAGVSALPPVSVRSSATTVGLDPDGALDQLAQHAASRRSGSGRCSSTRRRISGSAMKPHLTTSPSPATQLGLGQRREQVEVAEHAGGLVEGADEVLARAGVDAGLAADRGVDHAEQRGRHVHDPYAAQPGGRHEAAEVGGRSAADGDDRVGAGEPGATERLPAVARRRRRSWRPRRRAPARSRTAWCSAEPTRTEAARSSRSSGWTRRPAPPLAEQLGQPADHAVADQHVVRRGGRRRGRRSRRRGQPPSTSSTASATSSGVRPSVSTDGDRDRLVDRGALVEQRLHRCRARCRAAADARRRARPGRRRR